MTLNDPTTSETYYHILNIKEDASFEDIRQSYRSALLQSHPDKRHKPSHLPNSGEDVDSRFTKVQTAWETLGDSTSRALYDHKLRSLRSDISVSEDVSLEDMMVEDTGDVLELCHQCRCGDYFVISCSELEEMGYELRKLDDEICLRNPDALPGCMIFPCGSCSLNIRLLVNSPGCKNNTVC
ncbi:hypothetical protein RND81_12G099000 [Saponaria officinalis]|uniref:DPH4 homolog n=1 Tax=Saponaria officinalis TaxID=3572 RepID=A0AAW1H8N1_SAPOF